VKNNLAPIVLFVYNRPWHTRQTIEALQKNELAEESELFIYADAAKNDDGKESVNEVRRYIETIDGFKKVTIIKREKNWGLADSIIDGVTSIVNRYGKIIVLEDDLVTSSYFLKFMNEALVKYEKEEKVYSVTGYSFSNDIDICSTYFLKITSSWSWGTWKDKWHSFSREDKRLRDCFKDKYLFNYDNAYNYAGMAKEQLKGNLDSWAIYWYASVFMKEGLTLYPAKSFVHNIGFDGSGVHCGVSNLKREYYNFDYKLMDDIVENSINRNRIVTILKNKNSSFINKIIYRINRAWK